MNTLAGKLVVELPVSLERDGIDMATGKAKYKVVECEHLKRTMKLEEWFDIMNELGYVKLIVDSEDDQHDKLH